MMAGCCLFLARVFMYEFLCGIAEKAFAKESINLALDEEELFFDVMAIRYGSCRRQLTSDAAPVASRLIPTQVDRLT